MAVLIDPPFEDFESAAEVQEWRDSLAEKLHDASVVDRESIRLAVSQADDFLAMIMGWEGSAGANAQEA